MRKMIEFYISSAVAGRRIKEATAPQMVDKLERMFDSLEKEFSVRMEEKKIVGLDTDTLQRWWNQVSVNWKPATVNNYVCILNPFLRWAHAMVSGGVRYLDDDMAGILQTVRVPDIDELPEEERPKDKYYTHEQVNELLGGAHGRNQVRDKAIIALLLYSGLRVSELCSLTVGQFINAPRGKIRLKRKGGAWADAFIGEEAYPYIEAYLKTRKDVSDSSAPLFMTTHGKPCSRCQLYKALSFKQKELGVATGPHALRHTFVSEAANKFGATVARDLANHKNLKITNRYAHTTESQRASAVNGLHW